MENGTIIHGARLREILREELLRALSAEGIAATENAEFYLVNLLSEYHLAGRLPELNDDDRPLAVRFLEAMGQESTARAHALKQIGDGTLLALGFFAESIRSGIVGTSYYVSIGGSAYDALSDVLVCDPLFAKIYAELASKYAALSLALAHMAPCNRAPSNSQLVQIYRRWRESGDEHLGEILEREGIVLRQ